MHAAGSFTISLNRDFPFGLSLEPLQAYFAPHLNIAPRWPEAQVIQLLAG